MGHIRKMNRFILSSFFVSALFGASSSAMINPCTVPAIQGLLAEVPAIMQQVDPACSMQNLGATCPTDAVAAGTVLMLVNAKLSEINADLATVLTQVPDITMEMIACAVGQDPSCDQGATAISIRDTIVQMATGCAANRETGHLLSCLSFLV